MAGLLVIKSESRKKADAYWYILVCCVILVLPLISPLRPSVGSFPCAYMFSWAHPLFILFLFVKRNKIKKKNPRFQSSTVVFLSEIARGRVLQVGKASGRGCFLYADLGPSLRPGRGLLVAGLCHMPSSTCFCAATPGFSLSSAHSRQEAFAWQLIFALVPPKFPTGAPQASRAHLGSLPAWPEIFLEN